MNYFILATLFMSALIGSSCASVEEATSKLMNCQIGMQLAMKWSEMAPKCSFEGYPAGKKGCDDLTNAQRTTILETLKSFETTPINEHGLTIPFTMILGLFNLTPEEADCAAGKACALNTNRDKVTEKIFWAAFGMAWNCLVCSNQLGTYTSGLLLPARAKAILDCQVGLNIASTAALRYPQCNVFGGDAARQECSKLNNEERKRALGYIVENAPMGMTMAGMMELIGATVDDAVCAAGINRGKCAYPHTNKERDEVFDRLWNSAAALTFKCTQCFLKL